MTPDQTPFENSSKEDISPNRNEGLAKSDAWRHDGSRALAEASGYSGTIGSRLPGDAQRWESIDIQQFLTMLARRWKIIVATMVLVLAIAAAYATLAKPIYQADTTIQIDTSHHGSSSDALDVIDAMIGDNGAAKVDTEVAILKGMPIKKTVFKRLSEKDRVALKQFYEMDVAAEGDTELINIAVRTYNPELSQRLANAISLEFINDSKLENQAQVHGARLYVEDQEHKMRGQLNKAQIGLAAFKMKHQTFDISVDAKALVDRLTALKTQAAQTTSDRQAGVAQLGELKRIASSLPNTDVLDAQIGRKPQVEALKAKQTQLNLDLIQAQQEYTDKHPNVIALKSQIKEVTDKLKGLAEFETTSKSRVPNPVHAQVMQDIARIQGEVWASGARTNALKSAIDSTTQQLAVLPNQEYLLSRLTTDVTAFQQTYDLLHQKAIELAIEENAKIASASVKFEAEHGKLVAPKKMRILMLACFLGLILSISLAALLDRLDSRVHSDADAEMATRLPVLSHVPQMDKPGQERLAGALAAGDSSNFTLLESFQMLRTNIAFSALDEPIRSVVMTSTLPSEGKSTSALNLAVAAAHSGERVILVDCDLRRPSVDRLLGLPNKVGFTNVVAGSATLEEALQETTIPGLRVLTSGPTPPNPFRMLNSRAARNLLRQLRNEAEFVVIDTPPALGMADAQIIATTADAVLLVVSTRGAKKHEIARTRDLLSQTGVEMLGTILNRVQTGFGGYYGYGYGYSYYQYGAYAKSGSQNALATENNPALSNGHAAEDETLNGHANGTDPSSQKSSKSKKA